MTNTGTYGLATSIRGPASNGAGLTGLGQSQQRDATSLLGQAADQETARNIQNQQIAVQEKSQNAQMGGAAGGAAGGAMFGPWGALIGGVIGGLAGGQM